MNEVGWSYTAFSPFFHVSVEAIMATASRFEKKSSEVTIWVQTALTCVHLHNKYVKCLSEKFCARKSSRPRYHRQEKPRYFHVSSIYGSVSSQWQDCHQVTRGGTLLYHEIQYQYPNHWNLLPPWKRRVL